MKTFMGNLFVVCVCVSLSFVSVYVGVSFPRCIPACVTLDLSVGVPIFLSEHVWVTILLL